MAKGELPQVIEMEKSLLGALLLKNGEAIEPVSNILSAEDFYREEHRKIYLAILRLYTQKIPPNLLSLVEELRRADELKKIDIRLITSLGGHWSDDSLCRVLRAKNSRKVPAPEIGRCRRTNYL